MYEYLISVIVPVHNSELYLDECLHSILNQTFRNFEIILSESGSTDRTVEICEQYGRTYENIKLIRVKQRGVGAARNAAIELAVGKYISFVDSDDYIAHNMLQTLFELSEEHQTDITACFFSECKEKESPRNTTMKENVKPYINRLLSATESFKMFALIEHLVTYAVWSRLYRRDVIMAHNIRFSVLPVSEDFIFSYDIYCVCQKSYVTDQYFYYHRERSDSLSNLFHYSYANVEHYYIGTCYEMMSKLKSIGANICDLDTKKSAIQKVMTNAVMLYYSYQEATYKGLHYTEQINYDRPHIFWGASGGARLYMIGDQPYKNLIWVDKDEKKAGQTMMGYTIITPNQIKQHITENTKFMITSTYFVAIYLQLKEMGYINSVEDVMPMEGKTRWDRLHAECLTKLIEDFKAYV